jgi:hypothetical protein
MDVCSTLYIVHYNYNIIDYNTICRNDTVNSGNFVSH